MKFGKIAAAAAAVALASAPVVAQAAERASAPVSEESELGAMAGQGGILVLFALVALVVGFAVSGDSEPVSP